MNYTVEFQPENNIFVIRLDEWIATVEPRESPEETAKAIKAEAVALAVRIEDQLAEKLAKAAKFAELKMRVDSIVAAFEGEQTITEKELEDYKAAKVKVDEPVEKQAQSE